MRSALIDKLKRKGYSGPSYGYKKPSANSRYRRLMDTGTNLSEYRKSVIFSRADLSERSGRMPDLALSSVATILIVMGLVMVYSSSSFSAFMLYGDDMLFVKRQLLAAAAGLIGLVITYVIPYRFYQGKHWYFLGSAFVMLLAVFTPVGLPARSATGKVFHRSLNLGFMTFQPVEFVKLALVIYMADFLSRKTPEIRRLSRGVLPSLLILLVFFALIYLQPDLSSAAFLGLVVFTMLFIGGARVSQISLFGLISGALIYFAIKNDPYKLSRIKDYTDQLFNLTGNYHIMRSFEAIGRGGITGVGFGEGIYKMFFLPMAHTDFIFSIIGEELGAIGMISLIILYMILIWRGISIASRVPDLFGGMLAIGITCIFAYQILMNIGVALGLFPITGVTLPFISKGGSSLMIHMVMIGILLNISKEGEG
ncbi:TPA: cell division protein FtsW [Candidatus Poribacteria bacterium]|nr:cell division protein FtsW [Candidatus Poribacteria bacterium]